MKYKELFRLLLKALGVFLVIQGLAGLAPEVTSIIRRTIEGEDSSVITRISRYIDNLIGIALGLYFFFGGKWILNKAIPPNRSYCHECGYELCNQTNNCCPECGTEIPKIQRENESSETAQEK